MLQARVERLVRDIAETCGQGIFMRSDCYIFLFTRQKNFYLIAVSPKEISFYKLRKSKFRSGKKVHPAACLQNILLHLNMFGVKRTCELLRMGKKVDSIPLPSAHGEVIPDELIQTIRGWILYCRRCSTENEKQNKLYGETHS